MSDYTNPKNHKEIIEEIKTCKNIGEVRDIIKNTFPNWIVSIHRDYSNDYPRLRYTYQTLCKAMNVEGKGIILVNFIPSVNNPPEYTLLTKFLDIMTANGFIVRRTEEFRACSKCDRVIPVYQLYGTLRYKNPETVPKTWEPNCSSC